MESKPGDSKIAEADREARALIETLAQRKLVEVPSRAAQGNSQEKGKDLAQ